MTDGQGVDVEAIEEVADRLNNAGDAAHMAIGPEPEWFDEQASELRTAVGDEEVRAR